MPYQPGHGSGRPAGFPGSSPGSGPGFALPQPAASVLSGTGRWADDLWLAVHNEQTSKPEIGRRHLGIVIGAGLLAELIAPGAIDVSPGGLVYYDPRCQPDDELGALLWALVCEEPELMPAGDWLTFLAAPVADRGWDVAAKVGARLQAAGYLTPAGSGLLGRSRPVMRYPDATCTARMRATSRRDPYETVLSALAHAAGLHSLLQVAGETAPSGSIPDPGPGYRALVYRTQVQVDKAVLSQRT